MNTEEKFLEIYEKYKNLVLKVVFDMTRDYHLSQDICQETFLRLDRDLHKIPPEKVKSWLFSVSGRLVLDYLRKMGKVEVSAETVEEKRQTCQDDRMEPERVLERMEQAGTYKRVLEYLREEKPLWYQVVCMAYLEEKSNREIAEELGISSNLVSQWKRRASAWLRKVYEERENV